MFDKSAAYYDAIYAVQVKDYAAEAEQLHALIRQHKQSPGRTLLDIGCGTGSHIAFLRQHYAVEGLDLDSGMLTVARQRFPDTAFHQADMVDFQLDHQFDVIVCLFSSIGYVKTVSQLQQTLQSMSRHVHPGGLVIIEPWLMPGTYKEGTLHALLVDQPDLKVARMSISEVEDGVSVLNFHYLVATPDGIEHFTERHELGLFAHGDYLTAFQAAGLEVIHDSEGLDGRGLYLGLRPPT